jgi:hypothetical protein
MEVLSMYDPITAADYERTTYEDLLTAEFEGMVEALSGN